MGAETSSLSSHNIEVTNETHDIDKQREIKRMDEEIRKRVRGGVQFNMKIIIRGERGSGKSTLWKRFQGIKTFDAAYSPTSEIQSTTINWNFKNNEDRVKVDVWDVVDKAIKSKSSTPKGNEGFLSGRNNLELLDATMVDVYKDTHCVVFMINPFAQSSLQYVAEKSQDIPLNIPILIVINFRDLFSSNTQKKCTQDIESLVNEINQKRILQRASSSELEQNVRDVYSIEVSLLNCFGLLNLHKFLDIPFIRYKQHVLLNQLQQSKIDLISSSQIFTNSILESNYSDFEALLKRTSLSAVNNIEVVNEDIKFKADIDKAAGRFKEPNDNKVIQNSTKNSLKLEHNLEQNDDPPPKVRSTKSNSLPKVATNQPENDINNFQPNYRNNDNLENFLQYSDDEKSLQASKERIKAYIKPNIQTISKESESDSEDDLLEKNKLFSKKIGLESGKLVRKKITNDSKKLNSNEKISTSFQNNSLNGDLNHSMNHQLIKEVKNETRKKKGTNFEENQVNSLPISTIKNIPKTFSNSDDSHEDDDNDKFHQNNFLKESTINTENKLHTNSASAIISQEQNSYLNLDKEYHEEDLSSFAPSLNIQNDFFGNSNKPKNQIISSKKQFDTESDSSKSSVENPKSKHTKNKKIHYSSESSESESEQIKKMKSHSLRKTKETKHLRSVDL